jgi:transposase-like protein
MGTRAKTPVVVTSKSDQVRTLLNSGSSIADAARTVGIGYAFAYGIAKRAGLAETSANRRPTAHAKDIALVMAVTGWAAPRAIKAVAKYYETTK